jgi:hypothetical protein
MRALQVIYCAILAILLVISYAMTARDASAIVLWGTFGLAFPLFYAPTLFIYLLAFMPIVFRLMRPWKGVLVAIAAIVLFAFGPGIASSDAASRWAGQTQSAQRATNIHGAARTVEIIYPIEYSINPRTVPSLYCKDFCSKLLLSGQVDQVIFVARSEPWNPARIYRVGRGDECTHTRTPQLNECILQTIAQSQQPDLVVSIASEPISSAASGFLLATPVSQFRYTATFRQDTVCDELASQARVILQPTLVHAQDGGFALQDHLQDFHPVDLAAIFNALGYKV